MNDRFKFRAWDPEVEIMKGQGEEFAVTAMSVAHMMQHDYKAYKRRIYMQCTGLKDKNGKLIYEGDIVRRLCKKGIYEDILPVSYNEEIAAFGFEEGSGAWDDFNTFYTSLEVIGNIHEHPELLN